MIRNDSSTWYKKWGLFWTKTSFYLCREFDRSKMGLNAQSNLFEPLLFWFWFVVNWFKNHLYLQNLTFYCLYHGQMIFLSASLTLLKEREIDIRSKQPPKPLWEWFKQSLMDRNTNWQRCLQTSLSPQRAAFECSKLLHWVSSFIYIYIWSVISWPKVFLFKIHVFATDLRTKWPFELCFDLIYGSNRG